MHMYVNFEFSKNQPKFMSTVNDCQVSVLGNSLKAMSSGAPRCQQRESVPWQGAFCGSYGLKAPIFFILYCILIYIF